MVELARHSSRRPLAYFAPWDSLPPFAKEPTVLPGASPTGAKMCVPATLMSGPLCRGTVRPPSPRVASGSRAGPAPEGALAKEEGAEGAQKGDTRSEQHGRQK